MFLLSLLFIFKVASSQSITKVCGPGTKETTGSCVSIENNDVLRSLNWMTTPPTKSCKKINTIQGIAVCEDNLPKDCLIWSEISTYWCDDLGSLEFERYWSQRCDVVLYQFTAYFKGNTCKTPEGKSFPESPRLSIVRNNMWGAKTFNAFYKYIKVPSRNIDFLKIQQRGNFSEDFDGVQYTVLSDLFLHLPSLSNVIQQISVLTSITPESLTDSVGRESEHAWNMYGSQRFLRSYASFSTRQEPGPFQRQPRQYSDLLEKARIASDVAYYHHSFIKINQADIDVNEKALIDWKPFIAQPIHAEVPTYCKKLSSTEDSEMQAWINKEMKVRCHPTRLWVPCEFGRKYDAFVPCAQELMNNLAEDYAASKLWCDFNKDGASIVPLIKVDAGAARSFNKPKIEGKRVRLAFLLTVYADAPFVERLFNRLYSDEHYYLLHVDPSGATAEFEQTMRILAAKYTNVYISKDIPIVYGAATATILLTRAMAWFVKYTSGWDYLVPITGSDYPLLPLDRLENILATQQPPMPFVMAWTAGTSTHIFRLEKTHPQFEFDPLLKLSISTVLLERGRVLGAVPMEYRSNNFGPPLFCNNQKSFYHLDNRVNKSANTYDTQWLFPRDKIKGRGRAYPDENPPDSTPSFDGVQRVWKKSDPATTGMYTHTYLRSHINLHFS